MSAGYNEKTIATIATIERKPVRVVENARGKFLDIREWITSENGGYEGFTKKGIRLTPEGFEELIAKADEIRAAFGTKAESLSTKGTATAKVVKKRGLPGFSIAKKGTK